MVPSGPGPISYLAINDPSRPRPKPTPKPQYPSASPAKSPNPHSSSTPGPRDRFLFTSPMGDGPHVFNMATRPSSAVRGQCRIGSAHNKETTKHTHTPDKRRGERRGKRPGKRPGIPCTCPSGLDAAKPCRRVGRAMEAATALDAPPSTRLRLHPALLLLALRVTLHQHRLRRPHSVRIPSLLTTNGCLSVCY